MGKTFRRHGDWDDDYENDSYRERIMQKEAARKTRREMKLMDELKENHDNKSHRE